MKSRTSRLLYAYWNDVRGDRIAPRRFEIEPSRIASLLPETFILERSSRLEYVFRLAGTRICELFGREFRGANMLDWWPLEDQEALVRLLDSITQDGGVASITFEASDTFDKPVALEMVLLPLVHTGKDITRVLGSIVPSEPAAELNAEPLSDPRIKSFNLIWPEGRPFALIDRMDSASPFARPASHSRVVRQDRRSFRVYEGGAATPPDRKNEN